MQSTPRKRTGRPRKDSNWTPENLRERANRYFRKCDARTKEVVAKDGEKITVANPAPYTMAGLCAYLGITRFKFKKWLEDDDLADVAAMIREIVVDNRVTGGLDGTQTPSFAQFDLKNIDPENYKDRVEVEQSVDQNLAGMLERTLSQWTVRK